MQIYIISSITVSLSENVSIPYQCFMRHLATIGILLQYLQLEPCKPFFGGGLVYFLDFVHVPVLISFLIPMFNIYTYCLLSLLFCFLVCVPLISPFQHCLTFILWNYEERRIANAEKYINANDYFFQ